jgi:hypothetical protein
MKHMKFIIQKKIMHQAMICLALLLSISVVSCDDDDEGGVVELFSFGPCPVLRGNDISFIGQNLDQVTSVTIPNAIEVTDIDVISSTEISVTVPQEAEVGYVTLNYKGGSVTSKSLLGFSEPFEITSISPTEESVRAGDEVTISGDYLNNIVKVTFQPSAEVDSSVFVSQSREEIVLVVPLEASSGKIIIEDVNGNQLYSDQEFTVSLPEITELLSTSLKAGDEITISGDNLDLVSSIVFAGGSIIEAADFSSQSLSTIVVASPDDLQDGALTLVSYSGISVVSSESITTVMPSEIMIKAADRFKAGMEVIIEGEDLDLVTSIVFTGGSEIIDFSYTENNITVEIPANAIDGAVTLNTASGKSVETDAIELVKPTVTDMAPNPVTAGSDVVITGTDLDLVESVTFGGDVTVEVTPDSETSFTVTVSLDASTGELVLNMVNGESVVTSSLTIDNPDYCFIPVLPDSDTEINSGGVFSFDVENGTVLTEVIIGGSATQFIVEGSTLHVLIPDNLSGTTDLKLVSSTGDVTYQIDITGSGIVETVVYDEPLTLTWGDGGRVFVPASSFDGVGAGSVLKIYFAQTDNWGQAQINNGSWTVIPFSELGNDGYLNTDLYNDKSVTEQELVLTQDILDNIASNASDGNGLIFQGSDWIIAKISIITTASAAETIWEGAQIMGNWSGSVQLSSDLFGNAAVGKTLSVSVSNLDFSFDYWQVGVKDGSDWSDIEMANLTSDATTQDFDIDEGMLNVMQTNGLIISGAYYTLTKVEIK